jgi:hypothetical protein
MKAIRIHGRGGLEQLIYEEAPKPSPKRGEALVRVDGWMGGVSRLQCGAASLTPVEATEAPLARSRHRLYGTWQIA